VVLSQVLVLAKCLRLSTHPRKGVERGHVIWQHKSGGGWATSTRFLEANHHGKIIVNLAAQHIICIIITLSIN